MGHRKSRAIFAHIQKSSTMTFIFSFFLSLLLTPLLVLGSEKIPASVLYVIDGDTLVVSLDGDKERVRLIGVDTAETRVNRQLFRQQKRWKQSKKTLLKQGRKAKRAMKKMCPRYTQVYLEFDQQKRDKYRRLLAYVYLENGVRLNDWLIRKNLARPLWIPPNLRYKSKK